MQDRTEQNGANIMLTILVRLSDFWLTLPYVRTDKMNWYAAITGMIMGLGICALGYVLMNAI